MRATRSSSSGSASAGLSRSGSSSACISPSHSCLSSPGSYISCLLCPRRSLQTPLRSAREGAGRGVGRSRACPRVGDLAKRSARRAARGAREPRNRPARQLPSGPRRRSVLARAVGRRAPGRPRRRRARGAAQIEGSKAFAKDVMESARVATARTLPIARPPCVVKADGLAAGKGVWICRSEEELAAGLRAAEALGQPFHVEELLEGDEVSIFALCDGRSAIPLPAAQD